MRGGRSEVNRSFNISERALAHRSFVWFLVIIIVAAGGLSYLRLGRNEDPNFTIKTMVVQVLWPGANITDTLQQVTDRVEKKLQETPGLDYIRSYTVAGTSTVFITLKGSVLSRAVPDVRYQAISSAGHCRPVLQRRVWRDLWRHLCVHCGWLHATGAARLCGECPYPAFSDQRCFENRYFWRTGRENLR